MNVYVRELSSALARAGVACDVYTRAHAPGLEPIVRVEPGFRVHHIEAGPLAPVDRHLLPSLVEPFTNGVLRRLQVSPADALHANYWLSGMAGHAIKHELDLPLVSTFHTLARVKADAGDDEPDERVRAEHDVMACSDAVLASCSVEAAQLRQLYGIDPERIEIVAPAVDHAFFAPGNREQARRAINLPEEPNLLLFVGRIQALKGLDVAVAAFAQVDDPHALLVVVGGPSGPEGEVEHARIERLAVDLGVADRIVWRDPQPHELLSTYYRAADVVLVPSRSESFGLVALEAAACGTPVVAAAVGGLRTLVEHGLTGFLVEGRDPAVFAAYTGEILGNRVLAAEMGANRRDACAALPMVGFGGAPAPSVLRSHRSYADYVSVSDGDPSVAADAATLGSLANVIDAWASAQLEENPAVLGVERDNDNGVRRWLLRLTGEEKEFISVWFALRQRSLSVEAYFMPGPEENVEDLFTYLLRLNGRLGGLRFAIGQEEAVYLLGSISVHHVTEAELDRLLGSAYAYSEAYFRPAMRIGYATRFPG